MNKSRRQKVEHLTSVSSVVKKEELQEGLQETSFMYISNHSERKATHFLKFHLGYFFFLEVQKLLRTSLITEGNYLSDSTEQQV